MQLFFPAVHPLTLSSFYLILNWKKEERSEERTRRTNKTRVEKINSQFPLSPNEILISADKVQSSASISLELIENHLLPTVNCALRSSI